MAHVTDMKMALLAALIVFTTVLCVKEDQTLVEAEPVLLQVPLIGTQVLTG